VYVCVYVCSVWDYKSKMNRTNAFRNENARGSHITSLKLINDLYVSLLLCGSGNVYVCVCVRVCMYVYMRVCVCVCCV